MPVDRDPSRNGQRFCLAVLQRHAGELPVEHRTFARWTKIWAFETGAFCEQFPLCTMKSVDDSPMASSRADRLAVSTLAPCRLPSESVKTSHQRRRMEDTWKLRACDGTIFSQATLTPGDEGVVLARTTVVPPQNDGSMISSSTGELPRNLHRDFCPFFRLLHQPFSSWPPRTTRHPRSLATRR